MTDVSCETFIVVDVETSSISPEDGVIFSIGACVVQYDHSIATILDDYYYQTISRHTWIAESDWFNTIYDPKSTLSWWLRQPEEVQHAAWRNIDLGISAGDAAIGFRNWVLKYATETTKPIFAANPATFDHGWIQTMFVRQGLDDPFDYRTLCLRSMAFGRSDMGPLRWDQHTRTHKSQIPHHAFWDAYAAALDLQDLLTERDQNRTSYDKLVAKAGEFIA